MNYLRSLILRSLFKNKKRVFFIAIGILLSCSLIISLSVFIETLKNLGYQKLADDCGGIYDALVKTSEKESLDKLLQDPLIDQSTIYVNLGAYSVENSNYSIQINGYEKNAAKIVNFKLVKGRYPENDNEIAVEKWILDYLPQKYNIGDKITIPTTIQYKNPSGKTEKFTKDNSFTLVGILDYKNNTNFDKNRAIAYTTRSYVEKTLPSEFITYNGYINIKTGNPVEKAIDTLKSTGDYRGINYLYNYSKTFTLQSLKAFNLISLLLSIVISFVACVIIYNIFNVSVVERTKEFGMLRAVGASSTEIRLLVLGEGLSLGCIFAPIGIIVGNVLVKGMITLISGYKSFTSIISVPSTGIINCLLVVFLTIIAGTFFPARKAGKISPIEAINSNNNTNIEYKKKKNVLTENNFFHDKFGFIFDMAYLNINRNKKRFYTTVVSLSVSIIIFLCVNYLINSTDPLKSLKQKMGGDFFITTIIGNNSYSLSDEDIDYIKNIEGVGKVSKEKKLRTAIEIPKGKVTSQGKEAYNKRLEMAGKTQSLSEQASYKFDLEVSAYDTEDLNKLKDNISSGKIDIKEFSEKPIVILGQNLNYSNNTNLKIGDSIKIDDETFIIGALLKKDYLTDDAMVNNVVIMSETTAEKYFSVNGYQHVTINLNKPDAYNGVKESLTNKFESNKGITIKSFKEEFENIKKENRQQSLIMYSFVLVVAVISIINLISIMSMNVVLRNREIGMLRALGFGNDEVKKMIMTEGILYGLSSSLLGTSLGTILTYLFFLITRKALTQGMTWSFPIIIIIMVFAATNLICLLASSNASKSLFSSSIVDSIRAVE